MLDRAGQAVLGGATRARRQQTWPDDRQLREFTCDPKFRKVLITDGKTVARPVPGSCLRQGKSGSHLGRPFRALEEVLRASTSWKRFPQVTLLPLDLTDSKNVREVAAEIGGKVDIVVNNAEHHRAFGIGNRAGVETARAEMDVNYFGLLRLAQELGR